VHVSISASLKRGKIATYSPSLSDEADSSCPISGTQRNASKRENKLKGKINKEKEEKKEKNRL
jgi:hypothetical protein